MTAHLEAAKESMPMNVSTPPFRPGTRLRRLLGTALLALLPFLAAPASATEMFSTEPVAVFRQPECGLWECVERLRDSHPMMKPEPFAPPSMILDPSLRKWFGDTSTPSSGEFLLHCARGYKRRTLRNPVLLVHGAGDNANRAWLHPQDHLMPTKIDPDKRGFALWLAEMGYATFAITFAHNQGDNIMQAEQIANAIQRIRVIMHRTNDPTFKVDVIAHSKGNVATRIYLSDMKALFPEKPWLTGYRGDVRTYVAIASPFRGIDIPFRYYLYNLTVTQQPDEINSPVAADYLMTSIGWKDVRPRSVFAKEPNYFPGQAQLLFNLVRDAGVELGPDSATPGDANLTANALYFGGSSLYVRSRGIDAAIKAGGRLIYRLEERGIDPSVRLGVIAGRSKYIAKYIKGLGYFPMPWEIVGQPSDGVVLLASSLSTDGILRRGAKLLGKAIFDLNHIFVGFDRTVLEQIDAWLLTR